MKSNVFVDVSTPPIINALSNSTTLVEDDINKNIYTIKTTRKNAELTFPIVWIGDFRDTNDTYIQIKNSSGTVLKTIKPPVQPGNTYSASVYSVTLGDVGTYYIYAYSNLNDGWISIPMYVCY